MINENIKISVIYWLAVFASLVHIALNYFAIIPENWAAATHFALFGSLGSLLYFKKLWAQISVSLGIIMSAVYLIFAEDALYERGQSFIGTDFFFSALAIILALTLMFKTIGWFIPTLIVVFLTYITFWGKYVTGVFNFPAYLGKLCFFVATLALMVCSVLLLNFLGLSFLCSFYLELSFKYQELATTY